MRPGLTARAAVIDCSLVKSCKVNKKANPLTYRTDVLSNVHNKQVTLGEFTASNITDIA